MTLTIALAGSRRDLDRRDLVWAAFLDAMTALRGRLAAWATLPSWYLVGTLDDVIPAAQQRAMAQRAGSTTTETRAGHLPMLSRPGVVVDVIAAAADRSRP